MATNLILSQKSMQKAHDLALVLWRTPKGRSKRNGREFFVIPASDGATAHWTAVTLVPDKRTALPIGTLAAILGPKQTGIGRDGLAALIAKHRIGKKG